MSGWELWRTPAGQEPGITPKRLVTKEGEPARIGERTYDKETGRLAQHSLTQQVWMNPPEEPEDDTPTQLPLSAGDSLASLLVLPGSEEARQMTVTSGLRCLELYRNSSPVGCLARMLLASSAWASTKRYLTWRGFHTKSKHLVFRLVPSMPRISESEYLLWPTIQANKTTPNTTDKKDLVNADGTPWTPGKKPHDKRTGEPITTALADAVKMWRTPHSHDGNKWSNATEQERTEQGHHVMLCHQTGEGGSLNPEFVEWMMGVPIGWTNLEISREQLRE